MKALTYHKYGGTHILQFNNEAKKPVPKNDEVLVKVYCTTVNRTDWATINAIPWFARITTGLLKPKQNTPGTEFSGIVEEAGKSVKSLKVGDKVFGFTDFDFNAHGEFLTNKENQTALMADNSNFVDAAASIEGPYYGHNFINKVTFKEGETVLVNGATGGIGSATVQLSKHFGLIVTATCRKESFETVKKLGANATIDYLTEDFTKNNQKFNYVFDTVGKSSFFKCRKILKPGGVYISSDLGFMWQNLFMPTLTNISKLFSKGKHTKFPMPYNVKESLTLIKKLTEKGEYKPLIDRKYPFDKIIDAYKYVGLKQKNGNVVIVVSGEL